MDNQKRTGPRGRKIRMVTFVVTACVAVATGASAAGAAPRQAIAGSRTAVDAPATPVFLTAPDEYTADPTPTWTFTVDPGATFFCTLQRPFEGAWDGGSTGEEPPPPPTTIDSRGCDSGVYMFDIGAYGDGTYVLEVTATDAVGETSPRAEDSFRLDRVAYAPIIRSAPDDVSNDPTPTWTFYYYGEILPVFECVLTRSGSVLDVFDGTCDHETFTFDLGAFPDDTYTLSVTLTDQAGNVSTPAVDTFALDRTTPNVPPTANLGVSCRQQECHLSASGSTDSDGHIVSYRFDFGDGQFLVQSASFIEAWHTYVPGTYTATVTVTDEDDASVMASSPVMVALNTPPIAAFDYNCQATYCTLDATGSADVDGSIVAYAWSFGDGTSDTGRTTTHTYASVGSFGVSLDVTDDSGATVGTSKTIVVIGLAARGYKATGQRKVDLSWQGTPAGTSVYVYRNGTPIATVQSADYTDSVRAGPGTYRYQVCPVVGSSCSNYATVSF
jgi:PKD repeat protein